MTNTRIIGVLITLFSSLGFGTSAFAQEAITLESAVTLPPDGCALFVWVGHPSRLLFISQASERLAYFAQDEGKRYSVSPNLGADKFGQYAYQTLLNESGTSSQLHLEDPANISEYVLYKSGTITLPASDGWLRIESAQAVSACHTAASDRVISVDNHAGVFDIPSWLKTPAQLIEMSAQQSVQMAVAEVRVEPEIIVEPQIILEPQILLDPEDSVERQVQVIPEPPLIQTTHVNYRRELNPSFEVVEATSTPEPIPILEPIPEPIPEPMIEIAPVYTVQIGAYQNAALAHQSWANFQQGVKYLKGSQSIVQVAAVEGVGVVHRLRITGFSNHREALKFCSRLKEDGIDCYVPMGT